MSETKSMSRRQMIRVVLAVLVVGGGTGLLLWTHFSEPGTRKYAAIVEQLNESKLEIDEIGRIDLSKVSPGLTPRDEIYITRRTDGSFLALFPTYYGRGTEIAGVMYSSRPLRDEDVYDRAMNIQFGHRLIDIARWHRMSIDKRLDEHWYRVSKGV